MSVITVLNKDQIPENFFKKDDLVGIKFSLGFVKELLAFSEFPNIKIPQQWVIGDSKEEVKSEILRLIDEAFKDRDGKAIIDLY